MSRRRHKNPLTSDSFLLILAGAAGGAILYSMYQQQQANAQLAAAANGGLPTPQTGAQSGYTGNYGQ